MVAEVTDVADTPVEPPILVEEVVDTMEIMHQWIIRITSLLLIAIICLIWLFNKCKLTYLLIVPPPAMLIFIIFAIYSEFIFNLDNLCGDTFVRAYMDVDGFVPLPLLCTYQNVACYCAPYADVVEKMKALSAESPIEFNATNETVRIKSGWENVSFLYFLLL